MPTRPEVVVVDDDESIREAFRLALELADYDVYTAGDGLEGLELLKSIPTPCVILLDLMMPNMDGWAFAEALRTDPRMAGVAVVVVTAFGERAQSFRGARAILQKPIGVAELLAAVEAFCGAVEA